ncbi:hypothetical protein SNE40_020359 [Patella caerulea]|uniref:Uncharacterized protein n=1 Tax=Patella caerulea TaxID=87958 RepID=A0AAN8J180_PATCE
MTICDIAVWRAQTGNYTHRISSRKLQTHCLILPNMSLSFIFVASVLLLLAGDVERNPGPATRQGQISKTGELVFKSSEDLIKDLTQVVFELKEEVASLRGEVRELNLKDEVANLKAEVIEVKSVTEAFQHKIDVSDNILRQKNLIFYGIEERKDDQKETWDECEILVRKVLRDELKLTSAEDDSSVSIDRVYRIGKNVLNSNRPRPIKVSFHRLRTRDLILNKARQLLKGSTFGIAEDYSDHVRAIRKALIPKLKEAKKNSANSVVLKFDKLIVNSDVFTFDLQNKEIVHVNK